ncbi:hypothetical protein EYR41_002012 [Orbilia oligospora]|uniref:Uncharacterized protein n=1 Tax=Orbilia oligospora TaxID=2813651 RepID=A0A8H2EBP6_ORBOL|nr:hypothetical protein EYR41_002012 [Orbilia oligospora]
MQGAADITAKRWFQGSPTSWSFLPGYRFSLVPAPQISDFKVVIGTNQDGLKIRWLDGYIPIRGTKLVGTEFIT